MQQADPIARRYLYAGCYTHESSVGIRVYDASDPGGLLAERSEVQGVEHPSFLAAHPTGQYLYAVSETTSGEGGSLVAFSVDLADGSLTMIDRVSSRGAAPCYVSLDADGRHLYVANYVSGTIAVYSLASDGRFGELIAVHQHQGSGPTSRQEGPHAHCIVADPGGDFVYAVDLGTDRIIRYEHDRERRRPAFEPRGELMLDAGSGPRHLVFHPTQPVAFLVCELDSTVATIGVEPQTGRLTRLGARSALPDGFVGDSIGAEVRVHPNGHRVYVSNRGHNSIAVFGFSKTNHPLELLGHVHSGGETPRNFAIHPSGRALLVANQDTDTIVPFEIDPATGVPQQGDVTYELSQPVCLTYLEVVG